MVVSHDEDPIEDEALLTGTGSGGLFTSGYLEDQPLIEYLGESERVVYLLSNKKKGVRKEGDSERTVYAPGDGYQAIAAITDTRVLFVVGGYEDGDETVTIPYTEIENVKTNRGMLTKRIELWTTSGDTWRFPVKSSVDIEPAVEYLELAAVVWTRVERQGYHVENQIEEIHEQAADGEYEQASSVAADARSYILEAREKARELTTNRDDAIWTRIGEIERNLDRAVIDIHVARAEHLIEEANRRWRREQYNEALDTFEKARDQYREALDIARGNDLEETARLRESIDDVTQRIDHLLKAPLQRAEETRDRARQADDPAKAADLWEKALERYQTVLVLEWGKDHKRFAGDTDEIRAHLEWIVDRIEAARFRVANRHRVAGYWHYTKDQYEAASEQFAMALDHVKRALSVTEELKPSPSEELEHARDDLKAKLEQTRREAGEAVFEFVESETTDSVAEFARATAKSGSEDPPRPTRQDIRRRIRSLSAQRFREFVAYTWEHMGYETTLIEDEGGDIFATQNRPVPEAQLVVTEKRADEVTGDTIRRSPAVEPDNNDADVTAFVTTGDITDSAREVAEEHGVKLVDAERLCEILVTEGVSPGDERDE